MLRHHLYCKHLNTSRTVTNCHRCWVAQPDLFRQPSQGFCTGVLCPFASPRVQSEGSRPWLTNPPYRGQLGPFLTCPTIFACNSHTCCCCCQQDLLTTHAGQEKGKGFCAVPGVLGRWRAMRDCSGAASVAVLQQSGSTTVAWQGLHERLTLLHACGHQQPSTL